MREMWISRKRYEELIRRIEKCEMEISNQEKKNSLRIRNMAKRILEQPRELSEEIKSVEDIDQFIDDFILS